MFKKHQGRMLVAALTIALVGLPLAQAGAVANQTAAKDVRGSLQSAFEGWSVTENASNHLSFTITGKNIVFPGVTDNSERSLEAATPQVQAIMAEVVDLDHYGLGSARIDAAGRLGLVTFSQRKDGLAVESGGIRCAFNQSGQLVFVKVDLLDVASVGATVRYSWEQAESAVKQEYSSARVEQLTYEDMVFTEADDGSIYLSYRFNVMTQQPRGAWRVYVDVSSGRIVKRLISADGAQNEIRIEVSGTVSGTWYDHELGTWVYGGYPETLCEYQYCNPTPQVDGCTWKSLGDAFADADGSYVIRTGVGQGSYDTKAIFHLEGVASFAEVDGGGGDSIYLPVAESVDGIGTEYGDKIVKDIIDFDWTQSDLCTRYPDLRYDLSVGHLMGEMYRWYQDWLQESRYFERIAVRTQVTGCDYPVAGVTYYGNTVRITICEGYATVTPVITHEMAHAVHHHCAIDHYALEPWPERFWREAQAEHYSGSYLGTPVPILRTDVEYCEPNKCKSVALNYESHSWGAVQAGAWSEMAPSLGWAYLDELVWASGLLDVSTQANAMRSLLMADDNDGNLANGTPNFDAIVAGYEQHYLGPFLPLVFHRDSGMAECSGRQYVVAGETHSWEILDTYCWDSLVWNFDDGSAEVNAFAVEHAYPECGSYDITCRAYHTWGVNTGTFSVTVSSADYFSMSMEEGSDDYRFQIDLSLANAFAGDTIIAPIRFAGDVDMGYDSTYVAGTRLDSWDVAVLASVPDSHYVVLQFTGAEALEAGSGVIANLFFTAYMAPQLNDLTTLSVTSMGGYNALVTHGGDSHCRISGTTGGRYTLVYYTGDADGDGIVWWTDYLYLSDWLWHGGPPPAHYWSGDVDCSGEVNAVDVLYLYDYLSGTGPAPCGNTYAGQYDE